jgi:hypothetical protein
MARLSGSAFPNGRVMAQEIVRQSQDARLSMGGEVHWPVPTKPERPSCGGVPGKYIVSMCVPPAIGAGQAGSAAAMSSTAMSGTDRSGSKVRPRSPSKSKQPAHGRMSSSSLMRASDHCAISSISSTTERMRRASARQSRATTSK